MRIPKGFIKESSTGLYRRGNYIFTDGKIINEAAILTNEDSFKDVENKFTSLEDCIRTALSCTDEGEPLRTNDIFIDKVKEGYEITFKKGKNTVAIITPDNNVYKLAFDEIPEQDAKELAPEKDTAKAPKEVKEFPSKPKELKENDTLTFNSKFAQDEKYNGKKCTVINKRDTKDGVRYDVKFDDGTILRNCYDTEFKELTESEILYTKEVRCKDDTIMFPDDVSDYEAILQFVKDYAPEGTKPEDCTIRHFDKPIPSGLNSDGSLANYKESSIPNTLENSPTKSYSAKEIFNLYLSRGKSEREAAELIASIFTFPEVSEHDLTDEDFNKLIKLLKEAEFDEPSEDLNTEVADNTIEDEPTEDSGSLSIKSTYFARRPSNIEDLQRIIDAHLVTLATYTVADEIELTPDEFDAYASDLRQDADFLKSFHPETGPANYTCIQVRATDRPTLLIDNSGSPSAQFVGIL